MVVGVLGAAESPPPPPPGNGLVPDAPRTPKKSCCALVHPNLNSQPATGYKRPSVNCRCWFTIIVGSAG